MTNVAWGRRRHGQAGRGHVPTEGGPCRLCAGWWCVGGGPGAVGSCCGRVTVVRVVRAGVALAVHGHAGVVARGALAGWGGGSGGLAGGGGLRLRVVGVGEVG